MFLDSAGFDQSVIDQLLIGWCKSCWVQTSRLAYRLRCVTMRQLAIDLQELFAVRFELDVVFSLFAFQFCGLSLFDTFRDRG